MTTGPLDTFEQKEQSKASVGRAPSQSPITAASSAAPSELVADATPPSQPRKPLTSQFWRLRAAWAAPRDPRPVGFAVAFVVGAVAALFLLSAVCLGFASGYNNRVLPGVHVGSVDLSGLTHDEAIARLQSEYAYLTQGEVTVTTPVGSATITYQQAGRKPDVEAMVDAALAVGHSGNPVADAASVVHSVAFGQTIPVVIQVDPVALAQRIHQLVGTSSVPPQDAQATAKGGNFSFTPSAPGHGIDEKLIGSTIIDQLTQPNAAPDLQAGGTFTTLNPQVSDKDAQDAIARAEKMIVDVNLTWSTAPAAAPSSWKPQSWTITAAQIRSWIVFGMKQDGTYAPSVDPAQVAAYLSGVSAKASIPAEEPRVTGWDNSGKPVSLSTPKDGVGIDLTATTSALSAYLDTLASGGSVGSSLEIVTGPIHPQIANVEDLSTMVIIGQHTTQFFVGESNGFGANIRVPAKNLDGQVIGPGQQFSFLTAVGPIDAAHGWAMGGVILGGKSDHTGAMGGGVCSASTTMFNAAAKAGLQIDERHAHFYYINRYPVGKDATVYSNGATTWDLRWTNDTAHPILIRAFTTPYSTAYITVQLWSWPTNRTVVWPDVPIPPDVVKATDDPPQYVSTLKPGVTYRAEYPTDGFKTSTTRVVKDASSAVLHTDTWVSVYTVVNGQLQIGGTPPPSHSPSPSPGAPTPTPPPATPTPAPASLSPAPRRKVK